ncbi:hypothetical protein J2785_002711 [Burkholderia ambifaria]|nr:hypothetical protein [Burkholderia ambifaria]
MWIPDQERRALHRNTRRVGYERVNGEVGGKVLSARDANLDDCDKWGAEDACSREVSLVRRYLPCVSPRLLHHRAPVAAGHVGWNFERDRIRCNRSPTGRSGILDIDVQKRRHRIAQTVSAANHHDGIADPDFGRQPGAARGTAPFFSGDQRRSS